VVQDTVRWARAHVVVGSTSTDSSVQAGDSRKMQCGQMVSRFELCHHYHPRDVFLWDRYKG
jgi:hypothetical protein